MQPITVEVQEVLRPYLERIQNGYPSHPNARMDEFMLEMCHVKSLPGCLNTLALEVWEHGVLVREADNVVRWLCMAVADTDGNHTYGGTLYRKSVNDCLVTRINVAQTYLEEHVPGAMYYLIFTTEYTATLFGVVLPDGTERFLPLLHCGLHDDWAPILLTRENYLALLKRDACPYHSY